MYRLITFLILALSVSLPAQAYVGPGLGAGTIAVVFGFVVSFFLALVAILWYPLKRLFKKKKPAKAGNQSEGPESDSDAQPGQ